MFTDTTYGMTISATLTALNSNSLIYAAKPITRGGTSGFELKAKLRRNFGIVSWVMTGIILRDSVSGKSVLMSLGRDATIGFNRNTYNSDTSFAAVATAMGLSDNAGGIGFDWWMKLRDDGTNRNWYYSFDGDLWIGPFSVETNTTFVTPTHVGIVFNPNDGGGPPGLGGKTAHLTVLSWGYTTF